MKIRIKGKCKCGHLHIDKLYFGQLSVSMKEEETDRYGNEFCSFYTDIMINGENAKTQMSLLQGRKMTALKTRCEKSEHNDCNGERTLDFTDHLELELKELVFLDGDMVVKQVLPPVEEDGESVLIDAIDSGLSNRYKVLEGDFDTLYVMDRESRKEFEIKVKELSED